VPKPKADSPPRQTIKNGIGNIAKPQSSPLQIIDISEFPELARKYKVEVSPTLTAVKEEPEIRRTKDLITEDELTEFKRVAAAAATN